MKKLNRKGFTLIELLAVIVIMAIILIVTVPNIINSITDARISSIHNLAVSAANTYNTAYEQDQIATGDKILGDIPNSVTTTWTCIGTITGLDKVLGLSTNDLKLTGTPYSDTVTTISNETHCSSIRMTGSGNVEILLVANTTGKFAVAGQTTFAFSTASAANQK